MNPPEATVFAEPWEAEAFAMVVALNQQGLFDWTEWGEALGAEIAARPEPYYEAWLRALEVLLQTKNVATGAEIEALTAAWHRAAEATPHGVAIVLENDPERPR
ncbi:nitrile hydratase accessory protein [Bosea sp. (in: a-proteobacteria)]|uniref:nitrile hydratase accessory protein n=1 Tax=Bosea sp. (in: a-proteobacteria) TaxID=1871050 RepID=UPI003423B48F